MEVSLLWEHGKSQQYNLTYRGKMKKKQGRPKYSNTYAKEHYGTFQVKKSTKILLDEYCKEQYDLTGVRVNKLDVVDIAIKVLVEHKNFFQLAIDFKNKKK